MIILRKATIDDIELLIQLRLDYLTEDKGEMSAEVKNAITQQLKGYFNKAIANKTFIGIFAEIEGNVVATAYLSIFEKPANPNFITGITGTLLNVFTYPDYRRKGIATKIINRIINEAKDIGVSHIDLAATADGKFLYEKLGFKVSSYTAMGLKLK